MTSDNNWGERRERARRWRIWIILGVVGLLSGAAAILLPVFAEGDAVFGSTRPLFTASIEVRIAAGGAFLIVLLAAARWNWRHSDELRRREIADFWAVTGFATIAMFPVIHIVAPFVAVEHRLTLVYAVSVAAGMIFAGYRQFKG